MPHLTTHRNSVLCLLAVTAMAGCAPAIHGSAGAPAPASVAAAASVSMANPAPDSSAADQQVSSIDTQLSTIDGQLNAANAGLSTGEGDPAR